MTGMDSALAEVFLAQRAALLASAALVLPLLAAWGVLASVLARAIRARDMEVGRAVQRFEDIADVSAAWVWETDSHHRFTYFSDRLGEVLGFDPDEFLGRSRIEIARARGDNPQWRAHLDDLMMRRPFQNFHYKLVDGRGNCRVIQISGKPVFDHAGAFLGYRGTGTDVTASVHAQEAVRIAEHRARTIIDASPDAFVSVQADGRILDWNGRAETMFGWSREEAVGQTIASLLRGHGGQLEADTGWRRLTPRSRDREGQSQRIEAELTDRQGNQVPVELTFTTVAGDEKPAYAAFIRDITRQREAARALREAKEAAELANRTKSEFLAAMSHELRTPLNAVIGFSEVMEAGLLGPLPARYQGYAQDIRESGRHLLDVINDILDISKVEAGAVELNEELVDLRELVGACVRLVGERARSSGVKLENDVPSNLPAILVDPQRLKQIVLNLISNAVKFTPQGSVRVDARFDEEAVLLVSDDGVGMDPADIPRALMPFHQLDSRLERKHEGTGLGLPLCKRLAELHGGTLEIESAVDRGTVIRVRLPSERIFVAPPVNRAQGAFHGSN